MASTTNTWLDALDQLRQLEKGNLDAKHEIRQVLDRYGDKYRSRGDTGRLLTLPAQSWQEAADTLVGLIGG